MRLPVLAALLVATASTAATGDLLPTAPAPEPVRVELRTATPSPWWRAGRVAGGLLLGTAAQVALAISGARLGLLLDPMKPGWSYGPLGTGGSLAGACVGSVLGGTFAVYGLGWLLWGDGALWATALGAALPILGSVLAAALSPAGGYALLFALYLGPAIGAVLGFELTSSTDRRVQVSLAPMPVRDGVGLALTGRFD